jgi:predicted porin
MKKSLLALAALTAFAGVASAQSSVTLFGVIDANVRNVKTSAGSLKTLSTDGMGSSRLGLRGVEDIGGGLRAGFWLEGSVNVDVGGGAKTAATQVGSGANGQDWQRRATVSLMGGFGEIRLGRDYTPDFWNHTIFDPFGTNGVGSSVNTFGSTTGATTVVRANNSLGYFLPGGLGGLYGQVMIAAGEGTDANKHLGFRFGYAAGPLNVAFSYGTTDTAVKWKRTNIGGSYNMGFMRAMLQYNISNGGATGKITHLLVGGVVPLGTNALKFSYVRSDGSGAIAARDATQIALGYQHNLSKRTAVYGNFARIGNKGTANYRASGTALANAAGQASTGYEFGVNHSF